MNEQNPYEFVTQEDLEELAALEALIETEESKRESEEIALDLRKFIPSSWPLVEPHKPYVPGWHVDAICDHLMACSEGHIRNLVINIPPRHMKSLMVSVFWPAWEWILRPHTKWLCVSYARNLVLRDAVKCRRVITSDWYKQRWGDRFHLQSDQNVKSYYENNQGGARLIGSIDGGVTGEGGDRLVVDDPLKLEDSENKPAIDNVNDYWDGVLASRLNDMMTGVRVIIMQRLHDADLTGHVLKEGGWTHLYLPTEYEGNRKCVTIFKRDVVDPKTGLTQTIDRKFEDPRTVEGELLNPKRFGEGEVEVIKQRNGPWRYAGQQQQRPVPVGGGMFKRSWWGYYDVAHPPSKDEMQDDACMSWDCSFKDISTASYVVGTCWTRIQPFIYLLHRERDRMDFPETMRRVKKLRLQFPWIGPKLIEDKANGIAVISMLQREVPGIVARPVPNGGVFALAAAVSYLVAAGNVLLPGRRNAQGNLEPAFPWVEEFIAECESYPRGENNDQVASMCHALYYYHERPNNPLGLDGLLSEGELVPESQGWVF